MLRIDCVQLPTAVIYINLIIIIVFMLLLDIYCLRCHHLFYNFTKLKKKINKNKKVCIIKEETEKNYLVADFNFPINMYGTTVN